MSAVRSFYSGIEGDQHFNAAVEAGAQHVLTSYYYMREKNDMDILRRRHEKHPHLRFMIDSGAHSFQTNEKFQSWKITDWENYLEAYCGWLLKNRAHIFAAVELDIEFVVKSQAIIEKWQDKYFRPLEEKGVQIIYVWHPQLGFPYWEQMCEKHAYVGLPGELSKEANFNTYIASARRFTNRIHGFAASVAGNSQLVVRGPYGVEQVTIEELFARCERFDLSLSHERIGRLPAPYETWTLDDDLKNCFKPIRRVVKHVLDKDIYRITVRGGRSVEGTGDHSFFCLNKQGALCETRPTDMRVGDHLVVGVGIPSSGDNSLTPDDAEFYGLWFGDGYVKLRDDGKPSAVCCSKQQQPEIVEVCMAKARRHGKLWTVTSGTVDGYFTDTLEASFIVDNFGRTGDEKYIGNLIWNAPEESQAAFLRGYFSADGSTKGTNKLISLSCKHRSVLLDVQLLLERWDIRSNISYAGISGLGFPSWELAICDEESRALFAKHIRFIQQDQTDALAAKNGTKAIVGAYRGLPVSLLHSDRIAVKIRGQYTKTRPVYPKDRRTAVHPLNFCQKLVDSECAYLEITNIEKVSSGKQVVYDLCVPEVERFYANGILAHNTRQADYRDWPWYSIDSTSWKASEIYGLLMHWDDRRQKISYIEDKSRRADFRTYFERYGLDAEAIIRQGVHPNPMATEEEKKAYNRRAYMHITKYALITFRRMEAFYEERYKDNLQYYEMRLPHPKFLLEKIKREDAKGWWDRFRPKEVFANHADITDLGTIRKILVALASIQYQQTKVGPTALAFMNSYFGAHMLQQPWNTKAMALDLALRTAPPNPTPIKRETLEDFADTAFQLHKRELLDWDDGPEDFPQHLLDLL